MIKSIKFKIPPILYPVLFFLGAILCGSCFLHSQTCQSRGSITWIDSVFTAVSAICVTGLSTLDISNSFNTTGLSVILILIQIGGLGIMTFTSLAIFLVKKRVSLMDKIAVGQTLQLNSGLHLGWLLVKIVGLSFLLEAAGAFLLFVIDPIQFSPFSAAFHSISAFCNAGFSLFSDNMSAFRNRWDVNAVLMFLIIIGGLGFFVLVEGLTYVGSVFKRKERKYSISWTSAIVIKTTLFLIIAGAALFFLAEFVGYKRYLPPGEAILASFFQSVTARTAGFNTLEIGNLTNVSLVFLIILMFVGGAPGSCAGGVKVTTFRVILAVIVTELRGRRQAIIGRFAISKETINNAMTLLFFSILLILVSVLLLDITEGGEIPHVQARGQFIEIVFEVVSAFGTVGLSTGLTPKLTSIGKSIIILLMFIGRIGPLLLLAILQSLQKQRAFLLPEESIAIG